MTKKTRNTAASRNATKRKRAAVTSVAKKIDRLEKTLQRAHEVTAAAAGLSEELARSKEIAGEVRDQLGKIQRNNRKP